MSASLHAVRAELAHRLNDRQAARARHDRLDHGLGLLRGALFVAAAITAYIARDPARLPAAVPLALVALFVLVVVLHGRVLARVRRADRAIAHYTRALARVDEQWAGQGPHGARYDDPSHPYARDLDLFGPGSLFQLLCGARSRAGQDHLAQILSQPTTIKDASERQEAVRELLPALDLREALALAGEEIEDELDLAALAAWANQPPAPISLAWALLWAAASAAAIATLVLWHFDVLSYWPSMIALAVIAALFVRARHAVASATRALGRAERQLALLAALFALLESNRGKSLRLVALHEKLERAHEPASRAIAWLGQLVAAYHWPNNLLVLPFGALLLWQPQLARLIEAWRIAHGPAILGWLAALGEWEALLSIAAYAHEHPTEDGADCWPRFVASDTPRIAATALGHPLLPRDRCVRNDITIGGDAPHIFVVSGSNMSGKSTFLRTLGSNAVLAFAGAPVRATMYEIAPLQLGASMRVEDSLADGVSRFYAEVKRLALLDTLAANSPPLFFLIDEALSGTNSHDRRIGATAIARNLLERNACGLLTTHDLALAELVNELPHSTNVHFADDTGGTHDDERPTFDYRLRPGPIDPKRSNALRLMRSAGLRV